MSKNTRFILCGVLILLALGLYVLGIIVLPATIGLQMQLDGSMGNHASKYLGLLIPLAMTMGGAVVFYMKESGKALGVSLLGVVIYAFTFFMNLN